MNPSSAMPSHIQELVRYQRQLAMMIVHMRPKMKKQLLAELVGVKERIERLQFEVHTGSDNRPRGLL